MNRVIAAFKKVRLRQILMTFLAGVLLFVSTACNSAGAKTSVGGNRQEVPSGLQSEKGTQASDNPRPEVPGGTATSPKRDVINSFQGGSMNEFSDVDPRTKQTKEAITNKATSLKENAERNLEKRADSVDKYVENYQQGTPLGERVNRLGEDVGSSADEAKEGVSKGTQRGIENVKESVQDATKETTKGVNRAGENVKDTTRGAFNGSVNRAADAAKEAVN